MSNSLIKKTLEKSTHSSSSSKEKNKDMIHKNRANSVEESTNRSNQIGAIKLGKKFMATKTSFGKQRGLDMIYMKKNLVDQLSAYLKNIKVVQRRTISNR